MEDEEIRAIELKGIQDRSKELKSDIIYTGIAGTVSGALFSGVASMISSNNVLQLDPLSFVGVFTGFGATVGALTGFIAPLIGHKIRYYKAVREYGKACAEYEAYTYDKIYHELSLKQPLTTNSNDNDLLQAFLQKNKSRVRLSAEEIQKEKNEIKQLWTKVQNAETEYHYTKPINGSKIKEFYR